MRVGFAKGVAMTAIAFNTAHQADRIRQWLETSAAAWREMLDVFVSNRMRKAAAAAEHARSRRLQDVHTPSIGPQ
jgi:hypothetical protein